LKEILSAFSGEKLDIDPSLQALISWNQKEASTDLRPEPDESLPTKQGEAEKERLGWDNDSNSTGDNLLFNRVRDLIRLKHYSIRTEKSYLSWIMRYIIFHNKRDPK
jgi:hypothetical protein